MPAEGRESGRWLRRMNVASIFFFSTENHSSERIISNFKRMLSSPQYSSSELQQFTYFVMQKPIFEEKIEEPVFTCVYEENGVLYCASSTSQGSYYYTYCLNNPLIYVDEDGEFWHIVIGAAVGGIINLVANRDNIDNFRQGLGYSGIGAAAGGLAVIEAATLSSAAAGAITGGGNVAMQGGSGADIFAGAIGGALIGGSTAFIGGAALAGLGNVATNIGNSIDCWGMGPISTGNGIIMNPNLTQVVQSTTHNISNFISSHSGTFAGLGGSLSCTGAGNLFQFTSGSTTPPKVNLQRNTIDGFVDWFSYLQQNRRAHYQQGIHYHVDDFVDHQTILRKHLRKGTYGERLSATENSVQWSIADPHYRKRSRWNDNYVDAPFADPPDPNGNYFRIRLMLNRRTKISLATNSYDLYIKM